MKRTQGTIRMAVIGTGMMGMNHVRTIAAMPEAELVGVYDNDTEKAKEVAAQMGCKAFASIDDIPGEVDAASVVTPSVTHGMVGRALLEKGVHCLIEKPLAVTEEDCLSLMETAAHAGVTLAVGHIERFNPAVLALSDILKDKKIQAIEARRMSAASSRITDVDVVMDLMIHDIEIMMSLAHSPVSTVAAQGVRTGDYDGADHVTAVLGFDNGILAVPTASRATDNRIRTLSVTAEDAYYELDFIRQSVQVWHQGPNPNLTEKPGYNVEKSAEHLFVRSGMGLTLELQDFIEAIHTGRPPKVTAESALNALRVVWRVQDALK